MSSGMSTCNVFDEVSAAIAFTGTFCRGAVLTTNAGVERHFYGFSGALYEMDSPTSSLWTDRSGAVYAATTAKTWSFAQYGAITLAVNRENILQQISTGADFADAHATAPKGNLVAVGGPSSLQFVIVAGYDDGTYTPDGWFCSPTPTSAWTTSVANSIAKARLISPPGPITALIPFREGMVAFKKDSMWIGRYVGGTFIWEWKPIAYDVGCIGKGACVNAGDALYFAGPRGFYVFDGSYPRLIPGYVHETWADINVASASSIDTYKDYITATFDPSFSNVGFHATVDLTAGAMNASDGLGSGTQAQLQYVYNIKSGLWGSASLTASSSAVATATTALISARVGITGNKKPSRFAALSATALGEVVSPRIGSPDRATTLRGMWPNWQEGSRFTVALGPVLPSTTWQGSGGSAVFYAYPNSGSTSNYTTLTPTNNSTHARLEGVVTGNWVQCRTNMGSTTNGVVFDAVHLDIEPAGQR